MTITDEQKRFLVKMRKLQLYIIENVVAEEKLFIYGTRVFQKIDTKFNNVINSLVKLKLLIKSKAVDTFYHFDYKLNPEYSDFINALRLMKPETNTLNLNSNGK